MLSLRVGGRRHPTHPCLTTVSGCAILPPSSVISTSRNLWGAERFGRMKLNCVFTNEAYQRHISSIGTTRVVQTSRGRASELAARLISRAIYLQKSGGCFGKSTAQHGHAVLSLPSRRDFAAVPPKKLPYYWTPRGSAAVMHGLYELG